MPAQARTARLARLIVALIAALSTLTWLARPGVAAGGPDTGVRDASGDTGNAQSEQTLAVDPTNPNNVLIGFINGLSVSHDGGLTWKLTPLGCSGDNNPAFDAAGKAYYECDNNGPGVFTSRDKGDHWGAAVTAVSGSDNNGDLADRPWLVRGTAGGTLYLGYESFFSTPIGWVFVKRTTDGAATWPGPASRVDDANTTNVYPAAQNPREMPAVGPDGTLYVAYASGHQPFIVPDFLPTSFVVATSHDGGATFARSVAVPSLTRTSSPSEETEAISSIAADPSPTRAGHVALAWSDQRTGESRISVVTSVDGARTWSASVDVADDPAGTGNSHDHPQVAFAPDGRLVVVWRDRRCCGGTWNSNYELFARALTVGKAGPSPTGGSMRVTATPQTPNPVTNFDEYMGVAVGPEGLSVAWNQQRNGVASTYFRRLPLSALPNDLQPSNTAASGSLPNTSAGLGITALAALSAVVALAMGIWPRLLAPRGRPWRRSRLS